MREILFRGKRLGNCEWVYGNYILQNDSNPKRANYLVPYIKLRNCVNMYEVDPATVGQYTGLCDKNGKRIFEGDVLAHYNKMDDPDSCEIGKIFWSKKNACFKRTATPAAVFIGAQCRYEVIGNVWDNPELLEGGANDG